jgi:ADP-ribosyl-[dinitrogen reductase] hydrolase
MIKTKTSISHPLRIDSVAAPGGGLIGMTFCPGKKQTGAVSGNWDRDLGLDLDCVRDWGAVAVVTLMEDHELARYGVGAFGVAVSARDMAWHHLSIVDVSVPGDVFERSWVKAGAELRAQLAAGRNILLHCRGGLGRTGTIAARLLIELGVGADEAIDRVRQARPGAIETAAQEAYVRRAGPMSAAREPAAAPPSKLSESVLDRGRGALLGLAVGDALGTTIEFMSRDSYPKQTAMTGGGPFNLQPGQWTDDTSMALALADSLSNCPQFDPIDLMDRFVSWWTAGVYSCTGRCFDIGITTRNALAQYQRTGMPFAGKTDQHSAGNGSLMRLSPVALHALNDPDEARRLAAAQSRTTHGAPQAVEACIWFADVLRRAILGEPKASLLKASVWDGHPAMRDIASGTWRGRPRADIRSSGYVIHTLEAALWSVEQTGSFEDALVLAVNLGDDADTVGAVTGQLAGALYGASGIPAGWTEPLAWRPRILGMADALLIPRHEPE